jgi:hypothetical protein
MNMNSVKNCKCRVNGSIMQFPTDFVCDELENKLNLKCASIRSVYCDIRAEGWNSGARRDSRCYTAAL